MDKQTERILKKIDNQCEREEQERVRIAKARRVGNRTTSQLHAERECGKPSPARKRAIDSELAYRIAVGLDI